MIEVINLRKSFDGTDVLKDINITINKGDIVAVLGPSGSGKSTFLRCLNCMEDPTGGSIIFKISFLSGSTWDSKFATSSRAISTNSGSEFSSMMALFSDICSIILFNWA